MITNKTKNKNIQLNKINNQQTKGEREKNDKRERKMNQTSIAKSLVF